MTVHLEALTQPVIPAVTPAEFPAYVARIGKVKDNPEKLIAYLLRNKHWSPFEHSFVTFKIVTSRAVGRQLLRHRSFTFQELSQRYEETLHFENIELRKQATHNRQSSTDILSTADHRDLYLIAQKAIKAAKLAYTKLIEAGVARECARDLLPELCQTTILMTGNIRSWIHFLAIRDDEHAQKEIQLIAKEIRKQLIENYEVIFKVIENQKNETQAKTEG